jgi:hypothetical protein
MLRRTHVLLLLLLAEITLLLLCTHRDVSTLPVRCGLPVGVLPHSKVQASPLSGPGHHSAPHCQVMASTMAGVSVHGPAHPPGGPPRLAVAAPASTTCSSAPGEGPEHSPPWGV